MMDEQILEDFVGGLLDFCGCGRNELVAEAFTDYLALVAQRVPDGDWGAVYEALTVRFPDDLTYYLIAYEADRVELTEHGGSVGGAWLTDLGMEWLNRLTGDAG